MIENKIVERTPGVNYIELENVFLFITESKMFSYILFDENYRYLLNHDVNCESSALKHFPELPEIKNSNYTEIKEATFCLFQHVAAIGHFIPQFASSCSFFLNNPVNKLLVYETDNREYNRYLDFALTHFIQAKEVQHCSTNNLYKISKLKVPMPDRSTESARWLPYSNKLDQIIPITQKQKKYFNLKLKQNKTLNWTGHRCFTNDEYILETLKEFNYEQLDLSSEFNKQFCLRNSSSLILSWGGNHLINGISLFNKNKNILVLCHHSYIKEYVNSTAYKERINNQYDGPFFYGNKMRFVFDLPDEVENLSEIIASFEKDYNIQY